jgi:hypothetical protein
MHAVKADCLVDGSPSPVGPWKPLAATAIIYHRWQIWPNIAGKNIISTIFESNLIMAIVD